MAFAKVLSINTEQFTNQAIQIIQKQVSIPIQESIRSAQKWVKNKDASNPGVATGRLFNKISISTYGKDSRGGKLEGGFISSKEMSLFVYRPNNKDLKVLTLLEHGITTPYKWDNTNEIIEWISYKKKNGGTIRFRGIPTKILVGKNPNSSFVGGGKSPIILSKTRIMLDIERKLNINFN